MLVSNATCPGLETIPPLLPATLLFVVFGIFVPWAVAHSLRVVSVSEQLRGGDEDDVEAMVLDPEGVSGVKKSKLKKPRKTYWEILEEKKRAHRKKKIAIGVLMFLACGSGEYFILFCFCQTAV